MAYMSKKDVLASVAERRKTVNGKEYTTYEAYVGINPMTGRQVRFSRSDRSELKDVVEDFYRRLRSGGDAGGALTAAQSVDALQALQALSDAKLDISLLDCVRKLIEYRLVGSDTPKSVTLGDAYAEYLDQFVTRRDTLPDGTEVMERTPNYEFVEKRVGRWANAFGKERLLTEVTEEAVMGWLDSSYPNPKTNNNYMTYIRTFFNWCMEKRRRYILENPLECVKSKKIIHKRPEFMKAADVERLLRELEKSKDKHPEMLAHAIVSFFCGIRREEILRGSDDEDAVIFDFPHRTVMVVKVKRFTQGAHPRSFPMSKAFIAWAETIDFKSAFQRIDEHVMDRIRDVARRTGLHIPHNAGRHTFITQMLAMTHDIQKTCQYAGTSAKMLENNYNGLSFEDDATRFFSIRPSPAVD